MATFNVISRVDQNGAGQWTVSISVLRSDGGFASNSLASACSAEEAASKRVEKVALVVEHLQAQGHEVVIAED